MGNRFQKIELGNQLLRLMGLGGKAPFKKNRFIPYARQSIGGRESRAVLKALKSDYLTQGPLVPKFENSVANYVSAEFAVAVNSATSALHLACLALGVKEGDTVWTSAVSFVASANCALYCGAKVDFVDIDKSTYNMSVDHLRSKLEIAAKQGRLPKVVIPVHLAGLPADMDAIHNLSKQYGFRIIEDASHAIGASYKGGMVGNLKYSDITVFSFHPVKIVTTGEGGVAVTNNIGLAEKMRLLRSHGITRDKSKFLGHRDGPWYYEQLELGFNYRMTEIQAALGLVQMSRIEKFIARRRTIAASYNRRLHGLHLGLPARISGSTSAHHLYVVQVPEGKRLDLFEYLFEAGVMANVHYLPIYRHPFYAKFGFDTSDFPNAEAYYSRAISLPMFPDLTGRQVKRICSTLKRLDEHLGLKDDY
jgi:UDP-4-amino-4,6-dideoxy-N-acetyl-beta-L-altrosamine transaminase